jgi:PRC-barrel domain
MKIFVLALSLALLGSAAIAQVPKMLRLPATVPADVTTVADYYKQNVYDTSDQKLGQIDDLLVHKDGRIPVAMISVGFFLGLKSKHVAAPFDALQLLERKNKPYLVLDVSRQTLQSAVGFSFNRMTRRWEPVD